jgi:hypothetical protein
MRKRNLSCTGTARYFIREYTLQHFLEASLKTLVAVQLLDVIVVPP